MNGRRHYEFEISRPGESTIHNYPEPFERDDHFYRVLSAPLLDPFIERSPDHVSSPSPACASSGATSRRAGANDQLKFNGFNVINAATAPSSRRVLAVFNFDKNSDGVSDTSASLAPFSSLAFLTGVDNYMPSSPDASGTIAVREDAVHIPRPADDKRPRTGRRSLHTVGLLQGLRREGRTEVAHG